MINKTYNLKNSILQLEEPEDRLKILKDQYKDETAYIVAAGPSLKKYSTEYLNEFMKDKLCLPIKQSYNFLKQVADFHLLNFCNFAPYDWANNQSIVTWAIFEQFHPKMIFDNNLEADLMIPIFRNSSLTGGDDGPDRMEYSVAERGDYESLKLDHKDLGYNQPWGPGIMYEIAIPLAIHLGCKKIVTVAWDRDWETKQD